MLTSSLAIILAEEVGVEPTRRLSTLSYFPSSSPLQ
ncbi:hypothetical protein [Proteus phage RP7]|nr:hypothetical protein [Proteus phage RP7]